MPSEITPPRVSLVDPKTGVIANEWYRYFLAQYTLTGSGAASALTKADDTNVTLTLGGSPTIALLRATSLTLGWTGTLGKARGGTAEDNSTGGTANTFWARPNGATGASTYRAIVEADLPSLTGTYVPISRTITTTAPLTGGGDLSANRTFAIPAATTTVDGYLSAADWTTFNSKGVGSVTSVALALPSIFTVSGSPVTTTGTLTGTLATQTANTVFAGPTSGVAATPAFRALVADDIPSLAASKITTGQIALARGGTNADLSATGGASQYLKQTSVGGAIGVGMIPASDIASGAALTRIDDTNVTLTLGGTPTTALLVAASLTLGWTGTLAVARGGTAAATAGDARTSLGLVIGTDVQAYSARLAEIAALAVTDNNIIVGNGVAWVAESGATARTSLGLGTGDSPTFTGLTVSGTTATRLLATDGSKALASVANITSWIAGTINRVTISDDGDGTATLTGPQDIAPTSDPTFQSVTLSSGLSIRSMTLAAGVSETIIADYQACTWGNFVVMGTLTILGELRVFG